MRILVVGGAGYIGAHCAHLAASQGHEISIFDDFSSGHRWACGDFPVFVGNILDEDYLTHCMRGFDAVFHCAAKIVVSESVERPDWYA
jgi:UDP-glucose 4-epimerase